MTAPPHYSLHRVSAEQAMADRILLGVPTGYDPSDGSWWSAAPLPQPTWTERPMRRALDALNTRTVALARLPWSLSLDFTRREALALIGAASDPGRAEHR